MKIFKFLIVIIIFIIIIYFLLNLLLLNFQNNHKIKILLYYYNPEKDKDEFGNIKCSKQGLSKIERELILDKDIIKNTIDLLLKGKENLKPEEIKQGITTEYPLKGFKLKKLTLQNDGDLILEFEDKFNKTSGGSCRANILWHQIEETVKQFKEVKNVEFLPKNLFQP